MREFANIRKKNNVDVTTKRYRLAEPIAASYAKKVTVNGNAVDASTIVTLSDVIADNTKLAKLVQYGATPRQESHTMPRTFACEAAQPAHPCSHAAARAPDA